MQTVSYKRERRLIALAIVICYLFAFLNIGIAVSKRNKRNTVQQIDRVYYRDDFDELDPNDSFESLVLESIAYVRRYEKEGLVLQSVAVYYMDKEIFFEFDAVNQNDRNAAQYTAQQLQRDLAKIFSSSKNPFALVHNHSFKPLVSVYNYEASWRIMIDEKGRVSVY